MKNWFPFFSIILAQQQLKNAGITTNPPELLLGLFPAFQTSPIATFITNKAVVDREIAKNDLLKEEARSHLGSAQDIPASPPVEGGNPVEDITTSINNISANIKQIADSLKERTLSEKQPTEKSPASESRNTSPSDREKR